MVTCKQTRWDYLAGVGGGSWLATAGLAWVCGSRLPTAELAWVVATAAAGVGVRQLAGNSRLAWVAATGWQQQSWRGWWQQPGWRGWW